VKANPSITVCIPSIPPRARLLERALASVKAQTLPASDVITSLDGTHSGAAITRQRALDTVGTEWVAFLDDDDEFLPEHLSRLYDAAAAHQADYVFSWYTVIGGTDPRPGGQFHGWCNDHPRQTTITTLVRTELAQSAGFLGDAPESNDGHVAGEDFLFTLRCMNAGGFIYSLPEITWLWHHDSNNTSGLPSRW
jgi:glycosyltransferase involved in cell wall biosynthesis